MTAPLRVLVVDDTVVYRATLNRLLTAIPGVEVIGVAANGRIALDRVSRWQPHMVTLDVNMPIMDGMETLRRLRADAPDVAVVMVSSLTQRDARLTIEALQLGAFDFIAKPQGADRVANERLLGEDLRRIVATVLARRAHSATPSVPSGTPRSTGREPLSAARCSRPILPTAPIAVIAIGVSTGGPRALAELLPRLPADLRVPVVIVQHMPATFTAALADTLGRRGPLRAVEGVDGDRLCPGTVYLAPGGRHMSLTADSATSMIRITDAPPVNHCRPAVDVLFESVARIYGPRALGVVLTGMGADGAAGALAMHRAGARIIAQDEETSVVFGMPMETIRRGAADSVQPLLQIPLEIARLLTGRQLNGR